MKIQMTIELPDDFTEKEIARYKDRMKTMAGYYVEDTLKERGAPMRELVQKSVVFDELGLA